MNDKFAISSELVDKYEKGKGLKYDIEISIPNPNYFVDVQIGYDFLTSEMSATLYVWNKKNQMFPLGTATLVREENLGDATKDEKMIHISKKQVKRMRISNLKDLIDTSFENDNRYFLRLKFDKQIPLLQNMLQEKKIY